MNGLTVPTHHQFWVAQLLGAPYLEAKKMASQRAALGKRKAAKVAAVPDSSETIADGAIVGKISKKVGDILSFVGGNHARLGQVQTLSTKSGKASRKIIPICGFKNVRSLNQRELSKLPKLDRPDALERVHDWYLFRHRRDVVEAAHRLSFLLSPSDRNPFLEVDADIQILPKNGLILPLRITRLLSSKDKYHAIAISVDDPDEDGEPLISGCSFMAIFHGASAHYSLRPGLRFQGVEMPTIQRKSLEAGIAAFIPDPDGALGIMKDKWRILDAMISLSSTDVTLQ